jgi:hypothetical protein
MQKHCDGIGEEAFGRDMLIPQSDPPTPGFTLSRAPRGYWMHARADRAKFNDAILLYHPIGKMPHATASLPPGPLIILAPKIGVSLR